MEFLRRFSIRQRLMASIIGMALAMTIMLGSMLKQANDFSALANASNLAEALQSDVLTLRRFEKDFLLRQELSYVEKHQQRYQLLMAHQQQLQTLLAQFSLNTQVLTQFNQQVQNYQQSFAELVKLRQQIGLTDTEGLMGSMRSSAHNLEQALQQQSASELHIGLLQLRRYEKDFRLSRQLSYREKWQQAADALASVLPSESQAVFQQYRQSFIALADAEAQIGLSHTEGLSGTFRQQIQATEQQLEQLSKETLHAIEQEHQAIRLIGLVIFSLTLVIFGGSVWLISRSIIIPVSQVQQTINAVTRDRNFTLRLDVQGQDEMTALGHDVNQMLSEVQQLVNSVNHALKMLDGASQELSQATNLTNNSMQQQQLETDMVATAVTEMGTTIHEIASNTEATAAKAEATNQHAAKGRGQVENTVRKVQALSARLDSAVLTVAELAKDSQTIGQVLEVIRTIADQTNLLALNAAIEAARAGEQGRGFAVVADEVRVLAMKTQDSTKQIEGIIRALQSRTQDIVLLMQSCRDEGADSANEATMAMGVLTEITNNVNHIKDMTITIAAAIEEQSLVAQEVNQNVVRIRDLSLDTAQTSEKNAQISEEVSSQASELHRHVDAFKA